MSNAGMSCKCDERKEPINSAGDRPGRLWRLVPYKSDHAMFRGHEGSQHGGVMCLRCGYNWRTKAPYIHALKMIEPDERNICSGFLAHEHAMEVRHRTPYRGSHDYGAPERPKMNGHHAVEVT